MPSVALGYYATPAIMRLTRSGMLDVMQADHVRTARAYGLTPWRVVVRHGLRHAIVPVVSLAAVQLGFMLGGSIIIESIFSLKGIGHLAWESIQRADIEVIQAILLLIAVAYAILTLVADLLNAALDPRIRISVSSMPPVTHAPPLQIAVSPTRVAVGRALRHGSFWVGGLIILVIFLAAIFAPWLTPYDPSIQDLGQRFVAPVWTEGGSWAHPLGTDGLGRDYLTRLLFGARISLMIGFLTILISGTIGTAMGVAAGYWGGWVDLVVNFIITIRLTLPVVLVALVVVALVGSSLSLLVMRDRAAALGPLRHRHAQRHPAACLARIHHRRRAPSAARPPRILIREILPNIIGPLIVVASIELAHAILLEAAPAPSSASASSRRTSPGG